LNSAAWVDWIVAALMVGGAAFALVGSYGLAKLSDFYKRLHGPTKATTLGVGGVLLASCLFFVSAGRGGTEQILVALFLFITAPVSAHLLVKAVLSLTADRPPPPPDDGRNRP
jgi:multicomponent K+:H+ antiporter subunit G